MSDISIGLTQFLDFTLKRSSAARTRFVRSVKYTDYHPARDYWKQLRDEIIRIHSNDLPLDYLNELTETVDSRKRKNYMESIKLYQNFFKDKEVEWFNPGKSFWSFNEDLTVRSNPELGLIINGKPHLIKLYFKGQNERIDKHNTASTLTLMNSSIFEIEHPENINSSLLNIRRGRLFSNNFVDDDLLLSLESDALQFIYLWNNV